MNKERSLESDTTSHYPKNIWSFFPLGWSIGSDPASIPSGHVVVKGGKWMSREYCNWMLKFVAFSGGLSGRFLGNVRGQISCDQLKFSMYLTLFVDTSFTDGIPSNGCTKAVSYACKRNTLEWPTTASLEENMIPGPHIIIANVIPPLCLGRLIIRRHDSHVIIRQKTVKKTSSRPASMTSRTPETRLCYESDLFRPVQGESKTPQNTKYSFGGAGGKRPSLSYRSGAAMRTTWKRPKIYRRRPNLDFFPVCLSQLADYFQVKRDTTLY